MAFLPSSTTNTGSAQPYGGTPFSIGGVTFTAKEEPSSLPIGQARQMMAVHTLPGGTRIVQAFGVEPQDVSWSGHFWDQSVKDRVNALRSYAVSGNEIPIQWGSEAYFCIVKEFRPVYLHDYHATYDITVTITRDANGAFSVATAPSIDKQVSQLQQNAQTAADLLNQADTNYINSGIPTSLTNVTVKIQNAGPLAQLTGDSAKSLISTVQSALSTVEAYTGGISPSATWLPQALQLGSFLQLIIDNIQRGQAPQTAQVQGGSLFAVASKYYGDPTLAFALAAANGLASPQLPATKLLTLVLPPLTSN